MKLKQVLVVILHFFLRFVVPFIVPIALLFARKASRVTTHYAQDPIMQRYRLPKIFRFLETPDEDLAGGMYEPTVDKIYKKCGWFICSWYWLGFRNQAQGLLWMAGKQTTHLAYKISKDKKAWNMLTVYDDYKPLCINFYWFKIVFEYEICHDHYLSHTTTGYYAIPKLSLKRN